jgi:phage shock protein PspC (stress-responsive transcriptional regulator)
MEFSIKTLVVIDSFQKGYRTTIDGKILNPKGKELKPVINSRGYASISRSFNGKTKSLLLHKLTAFQKFGDAAFQKNIQVRHLNGNKADFSFANIEIGTASDNRLDEPVEKRKLIAYKSSLKTRKLTKEQVDKIRYDFSLEQKKKGFSQRIAKLYNVDPNLIRLIVLYKTYNRWK